MADNVEIQGLEFQIVNDSTQAVAGLQNLINTLNRLKTATNGGATGLSKTAQSIRELSNSLKGLNSGDASQKITRLANALTALSRVGNVKISSSIANQLTAINTALTGLKWTDGDKLTALANGLRPLSELGKANMTTFINQLSKLPKVIEDLEAADIDKFTQQMKDLAAAMKPFADEMQKVSNGFSAFPSRIQKLITTTEQYNNTVRKATTHTGLFGKALGGLKFAAVWQMARKVGSMIGTAITKSNEYQENMNLFTVAMGEYAESALEYGEKVSEVMGIDLSDWIRNQGIFMTLATGLGVASDKSAIMSKNLTQLGYDLSSFFNISVEDAMQKLKSAISGELEPVRSLGYALSQNNLQELYGKEVTLALSKAYSELETSMSDAGLAALAAEYGYNRNISTMTEAEKVQLRYIALMKQNSIVQGDLARTLEAPANQLRVLQAQFNMAAREIGNIFIPALNAILPYVIAVVKVIREIASAIASLFNFKLTEVDYSSVSSGISSGAVAAGDLADNLGSAGAAAKKLQQYTAGFDELNVFSDTSSGAGGGGGAGAGGGSGFDFELPEYDFLAEAVSTKADEIKKQMEPFVTWLKENMDSILETVAAIGTAMLEWRVANGVITLFDKMSGISGKNLAFKLSFAITGLGLFLDGWSKIKQAIQDIKENGVNFTNVTQLISGFAEGLSVAFLAFDKVDMAGASLIISGVSGMLSDISDMVQNGPNWENVTSLVNNLGIFLSGIGLITKNAQLAGAGLILAGVSLIVQNLGDIVEAFRTGDWSGVDKVEVATGLLLTVGGFLVAIGKFKSILNTTGGAKSITDASTATQEIATAVGGSSGGGLNGTLKKLAQNLGWGLLIITEVAAAALIITGAIALLGMELEQVGIAWQPVIDNGGTVAVAMGIGAGILVAVGLAAAGLGAATKGSGGTIALDIAIGTAVLVELGVAAAVFIAEVWGIGKGLDEIGKAWQPVLDNAPTIETAIATGTGLLVAIGVVTAALGAATVASAGLLPVAIGLGTAILVELAEAFVKFTESLVAVADELNDNLAPALSRLNPKLPALKNNMEDFTEYMTDLADEISSYSKSMGSITWSSIVSGFRKLFSGNPIQDLADDINGIYNDTVNLNSKLNLANPELTLAVQLMTSYVALMSQLQLLTQQGNDASTLSLDMFTNLKVVGENLVTGFVTGINKKVATVTTTVNALKTSINTEFSTMSTTAYSDWDTNLTKMVARLDTFKLSSMRALDDYSTEFLSGWETMWRGAGNTFVSQWNIILDHLETGINGAIGAINKVIREFNRLSGLTGVRYSYVSKISIPNLSYMKDGGFVDEGQLFIAREAGAEMVGAIGRKTAVANNDQIVEGITAGVTVANDGVIAAIYALLNAVEDKDMSISISDDVIGRSYDRYNRSRGVRVNNGAFSNAY